MTIAEEILKAVADYVGNDLTREFSRQDIRLQAGITKQDWDASYSPVFQAMRADQPGGAPDLREEHKGVFMQISYGRHSLTDYGQRLISQL